MPTAANGSKKTKRTIPLFWKILGVFWLTLVLSLAINIYITRYLTRIEVSDENLQQQLQDMGQNAVLMYEQRGEMGLRQWYRRMFRSKGVILVLTDSNGHPLVSPPSRHHDKDDDDDHPEQRHLKPFMLENSISITGENGKPYHLQLMDSPFTRRLQRDSEGYRWLRLLSTLLIVALASWWLSRHIRRPIQQLTNASQAMAQGNLQTRVSPAIGERRDELGVLGYAFDEMASHLENKITGQKQLLRDISHELRTPLTRQQLAIALLRQTPQDESILTSIERQNERLNQLLDDVLTLNRLDEHHQPLQSELFDLTESLQNAVRDAELEAQQKNMQIKLTAKPCTINGDPFLLDRVWSNLLSNSLKYSPESSQINVTLQTSENEIQVVFRDQGPGIAEAHMDKIFTPFYRCDYSRANTNGVSGGYGLGLAIVRSIIMRHGGEIELRNNTNTEDKTTGLEVFVTLPKHSH